MEVTRQTVSNISDLLGKEEILRRDVERLNYELAIQEQSYNLALLERELTRGQLDSLQQDTDQKKQHLDTISSLREALRTSVVMNHYLAKFVETTGPTNEDLEKKLLDIRESFEKLIHKYEDNPTYQMILKEEAKEKEVIEMIAKKKLETMKLETEQEY